jgi:hypothetical protein
MTDAETPRTTAPATLGDALTAEQIAAIEEQARRDVRSLAQYGPNAANIGALIANDGLARVIGSHAALCDRLARAEERVKELEALLEPCAAMLDPSFMANAVEGACIPWSPATPTDGAAPPRRSGEREGRD